MKLRTALARGVLGAGILAGANAALARRAGPLDPPLDGERRTYRWRGMDVAYTVAGDPEAPTVCFLHGINAAASSREFVAAFEGLSGRRVVAPDLPGFGGSDRPPVAYDADLYTDFVADFVADVTPDAACVASSLTGAYAALALRASAPLSRLVLVCPTATTMPRRRPRLRALVRAPLVGTALFNLLTSKPAIRYFSDDHGFYDPDRRNPERVDYQWKTAHQPGARFAPASFLSGHLDPEVDLADVLADLSVPITLVWGREAELTPLSYGRDLAEAADARLAVFDRARLIPHVEHPEAFTSFLEDELRGTEG